MLGVIVHWDLRLGSSYADQRSQFQRYDYACRAYNVDRLVIVDADKVFVLDPTATVVQSTEEALACFDPEIPTFWFDKRGESILLGFEHPADAVYVVGPDYRAFGIPDGASTIRIDQANEALELWSEQVLAIALAHRYATGM